MGRGAQIYSLQAFTKEPAIYRPEEQTAVSLFRAVNRGETELVLISDVRDGQQRAAQLLASVYSLPFVSYDSREIDLLESARSSLAFPCVNYICVDIDNFSEVRRSLEGMKNKDSIVVWGLEGDAENSNYIHFSEEEDWRENISRIKDEDGVLEIRKEEEKNNFLYDYAAFSRLPLIKYSLAGELDPDVLRYAFKSGGHSDGQEENLIAHYLHFPGVFLLAEKSTRVSSEVKEIVSEYKHPEAIVAFLAE
jgi:hypothetical protein